MLDEEGPAGGPSYSTPLAKDVTTIVMLIIRMEIIRKGGRGRNDNPDTKERLRIGWEKERERGFIGSRAGGLSWQRRGRGVGNRPVGSEQRGGACSSRPRL